MAATRSGHQLLVLAVKIHSLSREVARGLGARVISQVWLNDPSHSARPIVGCGFTSDHEIKLFRLSGLYGVTYRHDGPGLTFLNTKAPVATDNSGPSFSPFTQPDTSLPLVDLEQSAHNGNSKSDCQPPPRSSQLCQPSKATCLDEQALMQGCTLVHLGFRHQIRTCWS